MKYEGIENNIIPKAFSQMDESIRKMVNQPDLGLSKQIASELSLMSQVYRNVNIDNINNFAGAIGEMSQFYQDFNKMTSSLASEYAGAALTFAKELGRMIHDSPVYQSAITAMINIQQLPEYTRIIDTISLVKGSVPSVLNDFCKSIGSIEYLQDIKNNYSAIISNQKESFENTSFIKSYQKKILLRTETRQSETLKLGPVDFENSEIVASNINNTIGFVDTLSKNKKSAEIIHTEWAVRKDEQYYELVEVNPRYVDMLEGVKKIALSDNPEKCRYVALSLRELLRDITKHLMPDNLVLAFCKDSGIPIKGKPSLEIKVNWFFSEIIDSRLKPFIGQEAKSINDIFNVLSDLVHKIDEYVTDASLQYLINKVESYVYLLLKYNRYRN